MKTELIRKTWPKIRTVFVKGEKFYQVDARRTGTNGKRETFAVKGEAETRAAEIEKDFAGNGKDGLAMPAELRAMAFTAEKILAPYGKTIVQAAEFYRDWLTERQMMQDSALVPALAQEWHEEKKSGKHKKLRESTLKDIKATSELLGKVFPGKRIREVLTGDIQTFLDSQDVGLQRKYNLCNLLGQFFNWCVKKEHILRNPCDKIEIEVEGKDVAIFTPAKAAEILALCEKHFPSYTLYHAISIFAGLRPEECQYLQWEQVHMEERTIHVLAETSKIKEARNVHIEDNLYAWLKALRPANAKGYVTEQVNFGNVMLKIHIAAGFRGTVVKTTDGKTTRTLVNPDAPEWPQDVMRHSYGSYWLAKYANRAQLAENMGNSIQIIKKHYKKVVGKTDTATFWSILPKETAKRAKRDKEHAMQAFPV